jgi:hypothetical protein
MTRLSFVLAVTVAFGMSHVDAAQGDDEDVPYSDAGVLRIVERIGVTFPHAKKLESDSLALGSWDLIPRRRSVTRNEVFASIGIDEKRLGSANRGFFNDLKFATWQLSPSYSISISYIEVSPVQRAHSDDGLIPIVVYNVVIRMADKDSVLAP